MNWKTVPLVPWDPNNDSGLVAWSCDCLSEASITAAGGVWTNNPPHEFDPVKGVRVTAYTASSDLRFNVQPYLTDTANVLQGCQISFEVQTDKLIAYVAGSTYFQGVNATTGGQRLFNTYRPDGTASGMYLNIRDSQFSEISGIYASANIQVDNDQLYIGAISSYKKNFHTRVIMVSMGTLWQLWAEHQDATGKRIGLSCLTRSGFDMAASTEKNGMFYQNKPSAPRYALGFISMLNAVLGVGRQSIDTYVRNIQLVARAPTQIFHPVMRSIVNVGDSYGGLMTYPSGNPNTSKASTAVCGSSVSTADSHCFERALARVVNDTGINTFTANACHYGGSTLIQGYGTARANGGTANLPRAYITNDYVVPAATIWSASMAVAVGDYIRPITRNGFVYVVTVSDGAAGVTQPIWTTTLGTTVTLDGVTYECIDYDQNYQEASGHIRKGYAKPSLLLHYGGYNDADFIQRNIDSGGTNAPWAGYGYADSIEQFVTLWRLWIKAILDQTPGMKLLIFTLPCAPYAIYVNAIATAVGRKEALDAINAEYRSAPAYFHALGAAYQGRVSTVDLQKMGGWNAIGDYPDDYPDGTHPTGERALEITSQAIYKGIRHFLSGKANAVLS
jgi:hypothetical protein